MISFIEQTCIGTPGDHEPALRAPLGCTGIPAADAILEPIVRDGGVVLVSGFTGTGKTILAGQIAARFTNAGKKVAYVGTDVAARELKERVMSCVTGWPFKCLVDGRLGFEELGQGYLLPTCRPPSDEFSARALTPHTFYARNLAFHERRDFRRDPLGVLSELLDGTTIPEGIECLILDHLYFDGVMEDGGKSRAVNMPETASRIMEILRTFAEGMGIPVFVFCQRNSPESRSGAGDRALGRVGGISNFPGIEPLADVTIELTCPKSHANDRRRGEGNTLRERHFIMTANGRGRIAPVPVTANFECQRFDPREEPEVRQVDMDVIFREHVLRNSSRKGFIRFPRALWTELSEIGHLPSRLIYLTMAINADPKTGRLAWTEDSMAKLFDMDRSVVRRALKHLEGKWVRNLSKGNQGQKECRKWEVVGYAERFQDPDAKDYVVIARNILDPARSVLRQDKATFAVWLDLLFAARFIQDEEGFLDRGQLRPDYAGMAMRLRLSEDDVLAAFDKLERQGRIRRWVDEQWGDEIVFLPNFDQYQRQVPWSCRQNECREGRTIDPERV